MYHGIEGVFYVIRSYVMLVSKQHANEEHDEDRYGRIKTR
jgi:hypothetical protein